MSTITKLTSAAGAVIALVIASALAVATSPVAAQEAPIAWAVNGFGTTAAETASATTTYEVLVDGAPRAEALTVAPGERVAIPGLVAGSAVEISFRNTSSDTTTSAVTVTPDIDRTVDVAVHPGADGSVTTTSFYNDASSPTDGIRLLIRHAAASAPTDFQLYLGGAESGALEPVDSAVTATNGRETPYGTALTAGSVYTLEAQLPSGSTTRTTFTAGGETPGDNQAVYFTGLNDISGSLAAGESGPFILPILATSTTGGEGGNAGLYVINGFSPGASESANAYTVLLNGNPIGSDGGLIVEAGARIAIPQAARGATIEVGFRDTTGDISAGSVTIPDSGSIDVAIFGDAAGDATTEVFDNTATAAPSTGSAVVMRNIAGVASADMSIITGDLEAGGGTVVGTSISVGNGAEVPYGTDLDAGVTYGGRVTVDSIEYQGGEGFTAGGETGRAGVRAVYAVGSPFPPGGENGPVRSFRVAEGPSANPLAVVNGFGTGTTEAANSWSLRIDGINVAESTVSPRSRLVVTSAVERGTTVTVDFTDPTTGAVEFSADVDIPTTGTVDLVVAPDADGNPTTEVFTNGEAPTTGTDLVVRHAAGVGSVDVTLYEGGGESGAPLTVVGGPTSVVPNTSTTIGTGLAAIAHQLEVTFGDGTVLTTSFTPGGESGGALQGAYLVGLGSGGTQTNASLIAATVPSGSGTGMEAVVPATPQRFVDTRANTQFTTFDGIAANTGQIPAGDTREYQIAGRGTIPADAAAIVANFTAVNGAGPGFVTPYPCGTDVPDSSLLNYFPGDVVPNATIMPLSPDGTICVFALTDVDVLIDISGHLRR